MQQFRSVLAVLSEDSLAEVAFERALHLAQANEAALTLVDVVDSNPGELARMLTALTGSRGTEIAEDVLAYHRGRLAEFGARARDAGVEVSEAVLQGVPFVEVIRMVLREGARHRHQRAQRPHPMGGACSRGSTCTSCANARARSGCWWGRATGPSTAFSPLSTPRRRTTRQGTG